MRRELADGASWAFVTLLVESVEPLPVAFFPPVVFAIAIPPLLETARKKQKQTTKTNR
ncbi:hypothetical protein [Paraburkholderia caffeinitolerans]|uniref:hypothetical protein n=1 Tax=Paraburkholderia caffeinitolerans TaxID=1723730 RepID=UPI001FE25A5D|nr:hypothetical protein [Paraburkholderia caffeinitolerans]